MKENKLYGEYSVISEFDCCGKQMVTVRIGRTAHVMTIEEWRLLFGRQYPECWENGSGKIA